MLHRAEAFIVVQIYGLPAEVRHVLLKIFNVSGKTAQNPDKYGGLVLLSGNKREFPDKESSHR